MWFASLNVLCQVALIWSSNFSLLPSSPVTLPFYAPAALLLYSLGQPTFLTIIGMNLALLGHQITTKLVGNVEYLYFRAKSSQTQSTSVLREERMFRFIGKPN